MENIEELKKTAEGLRKQNKLTEAIEIYEKLWLEHRDNCNEWVGWGYAYSLRKIKNPSLAFQVAQQVNEKWNDFAPNNGVLAWCLYDLVINKDSEEIKKNESDYFQAASRILALAPQDKFSPSTRTVFKVIEYLEETRNILPAGDINTWLDKLDKSKLSLETWEGKDDKGRPMTHASDLEKWYAKKCKIYYELKKYQDSIDIGAAAFSVIPQFHYHYDKWIRRYMARSFGELGNPKEGIALFEKFMDDRSEWFVYYEVATLYYQNIEVDKALNYLARAALIRHDIEHKVNLFAFMGKVLLQTGEKDLARQHLLLTAKIRLGKEWKISGDLQALLDQAEVNVNETVSIRDLEKSLEKYWQSLMYSGKRQDIGTIKTIVPPGKSGFIATGSNQEYYFRMNEFRGNSASLKPGTKVSFYITPSTEPGKRDTAVNITLVKE